MALAMNVKRASSNLINKLLQRKQQYWKTSRLLRDKNLEWWAYLWLRSLSCCSVVAWGFLGVCPCRPCSIWSTCRWRSWTRCTVTAPGRWGSRGRKTSPNKSSPPGRSSQIVRDCSFQTRTLYHSTIQYHRIWPACGRLKLTESWQCLLCLPRKWA